jgi:hypothetical protein
MQSPVRTGKALSVLLLSRLDLVIAKKKEFLIFHTMLEFNRPSTLKDQFHACDSTEAFRALLKPLQCTVLSVFRIITK